jgi:5-methylthioadenosine/S-adenosylhomocysteine deaminase
VYSARAADVRTVLVAGRVLVQDGRLTELDAADVAREAIDQRTMLLARTNVAA